MQWNMLVTMRQVALALGIAALSTAPLGCDGAQASDTSAATATTTTEESDERIRPHFPPNPPGAAR